MHARLIPSYYLERVAATRTVTQGEALRVLAERLRTSLFEPDGPLGALSVMKQNALKAEAAKLAEVFQRSSANVEGRNGYLSLRNHQLPAFRAKKRGDRRGYNSCKAHSCQGLYSLVRAPMPLSPVRGRRAPWPTSA
jgi:hypothetical protein